MQWQPSLPHQALGLLSTLAVKLIILIGISNILMLSGSPSICVTQLTFSSGNVVCCGNILAMVLQIIEQCVRLLKLRWKAIQCQVCGRKTKSAHDTQWKDNIWQSLTLIRCK
jgi:hypothetical protein